MSVARFWWITIGVLYSAALFELVGPLFAALPMTLVIGVGIVLVIALLAAIVLAFRLVRQPQKARPRSTSQERFDVFDVAAQPTQPLAPRASVSMPVPAPAPVPMPASTPTPAPPVRKPAQKPLPPAAWMDEVDDEDRLLQDFRQSSQALRRFHTQKRPHPEVAPHLIAAPAESSPSPLNHQPFASEEEMVSARDQSQVLHIPQSDRRTPKDTHQSRNHGNHPRKRTNRGGGNARRYA